MTAPLAVNERDEAEQVAQMEAGRGRVETAIARLNTVGH